MGTMTNWLRKNIGIIISSIGFTLLVILTFGDIGELFTEAYWRNVGGNITSIGALTVGLVMIQVTIKQGVSEQALSAGLNTENTKNKYEEHKKLISLCKENWMYLPYFLSIRNKRETIRRKKEFLVENNFTSEKKLYDSKNKKIIRVYEKIKTNITVDSIKWSTTKIVYDKNGRIEKLDKFRRKRAIKGFVTGFIYMFASTLIAGGLFLDIYDVPLWQKFVRLFAYVIVIAFTVVFDIGRNYEKGAFGVPNELDEVNSIWQEFRDWQIPVWVIEEVEKNSVVNAEVNTEKTSEIKKYSSDPMSGVMLLASPEETRAFSKDSKEENIMEEKVDEQEEKENFDIGANLQKEQAQIEAI